MIQYLESPALNDRAITPHPMHAGMGAGQAPEPPIHILLVEDDRDVSATLGRFLLSRGIQVSVAENSAAAIQRLAQLEPGSITVALSDVNMPGTSGLELASDLMRATSGVCALEVVMMTGDRDVSIAVQALRAKVFDFVHKPFGLKDLLETLRRAHAQALARRRLDRRAAEAAARIGALTRDVISSHAQSDRLADVVSQLAAENSMLRDVSLASLEVMSELRDAETGHHIQRTRSYVEALIDILRPHPRFARELADTALCRRIIDAVPLHDIGKIAIPDAILLKPGPLTAEERKIINTHTIVGATMIDEAIKRAQARTGRLPSGQDDPSLAFLRIARDIAATHHERWDGTGYPAGLAGTNIPLAGRLMAIADVFDALISKRPYKEPLPLETAMAIIQQERGTHFDADITDAFLTHIQTFATIGQQSGLTLAA